MEWDTRARLYLLSSVDDKLDGSKGINGKRTVWNMIFNVPEEKISIVVTVFNNSIYKVSDPVKEEVEPDGFIDVNNLRIDSDKIADISKKGDALIPVSAEFRQGFHYKLYRQDRDTVISIDGSNQHGEYKKIIYNATTGVPIS